MSDYESDEEFVLPPGFEVATGGAITKAALDGDRELWLFRAKTMKLPKEKNGSLHVPVPVAGSTKSYALKSQDLSLCQQLVNIVPDAVNSKTFVPGKPFARSFSLVETIEIPTKSAVVVASAEPAKKKAKKKATAEPVVVDAEPVKKKKKSKKVAA
ncbi:hypothetical protein SPRG_20041 [Saprolegnia parasitica CBS 223.65]|uniref:Uncharacterized protein n=1 Tax=Saprolegnia parasitica (strain CBS 223.65) TaxID=695850 RepID=A0A067CDK6_SAPPC|nr:hypothetical protein SPRG_20041 [Saprolegnia parasitica CBS 223.65]KDO28839.1 hypothetical protein SPRG_20041 [Saprolegnia parasitica CBS 223.65]|eukprot:XP_012200569.1 hypothetical protein SPRG_20041 [Saprolegnia parasitica CBS 223.65]